MLLESSRAIYTVEYSRRGYVMKEELFAELMESAQEALDHARGKRELRTTVLPEPPEPMAAAEVKELRTRLNASQAVFAHYLNVSTKLVQAWEAERRHPDGAALKLLRVAERMPSAVFSAAGADVPPDADRRKAGIPPRSGASRKVVTGSRRGHPASVADAPKPGRARSKRAGNRTSKK